MYLLFRYNEAQLVYTCYVTVSKTYFMWTEGISKNVLK